MPVEQEDAPHMKATKTKPILQTQTEPVDFIPSQTQIDALAHRIMPEIKRFFADETIQREFKEWQAKHNTDRSDK
jgi:hypothetical protein